MKKVVFIIALSFISAQFSCTTEATSAEAVAYEVQEGKIARNIDSDEFNRLLKEKQSAILLDVRTPAEVAQGYLAGAKNIDINNQNFRSEIDKLDKNQPILVYCRSGRRSEAAMRYMKDIGFVEVYNLAGGIIAWDQAGLPTTK